LSCTKRHDDYASLCRNARALADSAIQTIFGGQKFGGEYG